MKEFQERRVLRKIIFSRFTFAFLAAILIFFGYSTVKIYLRLKDASGINALIEKQIADLKTRKAESEANIGRLQTETGAEEEIRNKFPVRKPGEKTVIIIEEEIKNNLSSESMPIGFFPKIWQFIKNIFPAKMP